MLQLNELYLGDCLEVMKDIDSDSIDMILCDLPYGKTVLEWDSIINFELLWKQYIRVIKEKTPIVLFGVQPFSSGLICSNLKMFKYSWVWNKKIPSIGVWAKKRPLAIVEDILIFGHKNLNYFPQMTKGKRVVSDQVKTIKGAFGNRKARLIHHDNHGEYYPKNIIEFSAANRKGRLHPTQKPLALFEYLIKTYTNESMLVLDNCIGSGTTAIAAINTKRNWIGIEKDNIIYEIAKNRIKNHLKCKNNED